MLKIDKQTSWQALMLFIREHDVVQTLNNSSSDVTGQSMKKYYTTEMRRGVSWRTCAPDSSLTGHVTLLISLVLRHRTN